MAIDNNQVGTGKYYSEIYVSIKFLILLYFQPYCEMLGSTLT